MLTYYLILFILLIIVFILFNNFPKKNEQKILPCGKKLNELTDEEYIEYFLPYIIQRWEEREKPRGMSLEEYIDKYVRTENKGICTPLRLSIEELKHNSITDEEFFDTYLLDIIKDWEANEKTNGISLNKYLWDNYKKVQEDEKYAKIFVDKVVDISDLLIISDWKKCLQNEDISLEEFIDREYRGTKEEKEKIIEVKEKKIKEYLSSLDFNDIVKDWKRERRVEDISLKDFIKRDYDLPPNVENEDKILEEFVNRELKKSGT